MTDLPHRAKSSHPDNRLPRLRSDSDVTPVDMDVRTQSIEMLLLPFNAWQAWLQHVATLSIAAQREWFTFIERRLSQDASLGGELATCKAPDDIVRACTSFYRTAAIDYQTELAEMVRLSGAAMTPPPATH